MSDIPGNTIRTPQLEPEQVAALYPHLSIDRNELGHLTIYVGANNPEEPEPLAYASRLVVCPIWLSDDRVGPLIAINVCSGSDVPLSDPLVRLVVEPDDPSVHFIVKTAEGSQAIEVEDIIRNVRDGVYLFDAYDRLPFYEKSSVVASKVHDRLPRTPEMSNASVGEIAIKALLASTDLTPRQILDLLVTIFVTPSPVLSYSVI